MTLRNFALVCLLPLLAACAAVPQTSRRAPAPAPDFTVAPVPPQTPPPLPAEAFRSAEIQRIPGLEWLFQQDARALIGTFGTPRLDVAEGDMRKLQFTGAPCVLDVFLYPLRSGAEPVATHVEARRASDGVEVDRRSCVQALRRR